MEIKITTLVASSVIRTDTNPIATGWLKTEAPIALRRTLSRVLLNKGYEIKWSAHKFTLL